MAEDILSMSEDAPQTDAPKHDTATPVGMTSIIETGPVASFSQHDVDTLTCLLTGSWTPQDKVRESAESLRDRLSVYLEGRAWQEKKIAERLAVLHAKAAELTEEVRRRIETGAEATELIERGRRIGEEMARLEGCQ